MDINLDGRQYIEKSKLILCEIVFVKLISSAGGGGLDTACDYSSPG
jgi:hypothetical protein